MSAKSISAKAARWATESVVNRTLPAAPQWERVSATAVFTFNVRRTRDLHDNGRMALKHYVDGIASVICEGGKDDGWEWESVTEVVDRAAVEGVTITVWEILESEEK